MTAHYQANGPDASRGAALILARAAREKARTAAPYAPSSRPRPFPGGSRRYWTLRALFLEHVDIYHRRGWRPEWDARIAWIGRG